MSARLVVGAVNKTIVVHGDRIFPIASEEPDRASKRDRVSASLWDPRDWLAHPLPSDIDASFFNRAPLDQQADQIAPDERILLEHLHPEHPRLVTRLDGVVPHAVLWRTQQPERPVALRCDTLWIDTDRSVCCVTWRGSIPLEAAEGAEIHVTAAGHAPDPAVATIAAGLLAAVQASPLPFVPPAIGAVPAVALHAERREPRETTADGTDTVLAPLVVQAVGLPFVRTSAPAAIPPEPIAAPPPPVTRRSSASTPEQEPRSRSDARAAPPPPPAMLGGIPLATEQAPTPAPSAEPEAPTLDPEAFSIERWAEIVAELDKALHPRAEMLRAHDLTPRDLIAVERHWSAALNSEAASGGFSLRFKYDAAYVGALERLRGRPLSASEYAQILVAAERRQVAAALGDLEMPAAAHLPIVRLWTGKLARDPKLAFEMIQAVAALRGGAAGPASTTS